MGSMAFRGVLGAIFFVVGLQISAPLAAQTPSPLPNPNVQLHINGEVTAIAHHPDGGIVLGGLFDSINGVARGNIARLLPDGSLDLVWNPAANFWVRSLVVDSSGDVFVGGQFTNIGGQTRQYIAKLSGSGSGQADSNWNPSADGLVNKLAMDSFGSIYAAGSFSNIGGQSREFIAKLSGTGNGLADANWNASADSYVGALAVDSSDALYVGGSFNNIGGNARNYIAKLPSGGNGSSDASWNPSPDDGVYALVIQAGMLYVGGGFSSIGGQSHHRIARLSTAGNGAADSIWDPAADDVVLALTVDGSGAVYAGGRFSSIGGQPRSRIAKLSGSGTGTADLFWNPSADEPVKALAVRSAGGVYAGGEFKSLNSQSRFGFAVVEGDGTLGTNIDVERSSTAVYATAIQPDGGLIVAGDFMKANNLYRSNLLRLNADGTLDPDWNPSANSQVRELATDSSGGVYASGLFTRVGGQSRNGLVKISGDASGEVDTNWNPSPNGYVYALAVDDDGAVYAGGAFSNIGGSPRARIAKLSGITGLADTIWNPTASGEVFALALDSSGDLYAGGWFQSIGGQPRTRIAKLSGTGNGAADANWNPTANSTVYSLVVDESDAVYAGGEFTSIGGELRNRIAKLEAGGSGVVDLAWNPSADDGVYVLSSDGNGAIYAGGTFTTIGGQMRNHIAKLSATGLGIADERWDPSPDGGVYALSIGESGAVYVGGDFNAIGGQSRARIAALPGDTDLIFQDGFEESAPDRDFQ